MPVKTRWMRIKEWLRNKFLPAIDLRERVDELERVLYDLCDKAALREDRRCQNKQEQAND